MEQDTITATLAIMQPDDLYPCWNWFDMLERHGMTERDEANQWKHGIYELMLRWGLEPRIWSQKPRP